MQFSRVYFNAEYKITHICIEGYARGLEPVVCTIVLICYIQQPTKYFLNTFWCHGIKNYYSYKISEKQKPCLQLFHSIVRHFVLLFIIIIIVAIILNAACC